MDKIPCFIKTKKIQLGIATTDYCNAKCQCCVWPEVTSSKKKMGVDEFKILISRFKEYQFSEFALNVINEPFTDSTLIDKYQYLLSQDNLIDVLYHSSNWVLPDRRVIESFTHLIETVDSSKNIQKLSLNATCSGINETTYAKLQGINGRGFKRAVKNIKYVVKKLSLINSQKLVNFRIKAYGDIFTQQEFQSFWMNQLTEYGVSADYVEKNVRFVINQNYTSFARQNKKKRFITPKKKCVTGWLTEKLVILADGSVGLCCNDGMQNIVFGNLIQQSIEDIVSTRIFQKSLDIILGNKRTKNQYPCGRCEFFK
jgi:hypothetical protein